ncbi:isoprenylcysteine carboxylmethyltransferase family protein [Rhizobium sp. TRM95111]|uniref:methyltransferase family protein n=1 Tax=Rhizobium alarense TaxID=2846851 RepID=UPI001F24F86B|nr:isoprenylcysteine carboxylmethyltransferase family protein [Rhizobium alarense]MCF3638597.1 isoprenylcysteine carboxylmethyltransferase family protein [Rhizobium alarense]
MTGFDFNHLPTVQVVRRMTIIAALIALAVSLLFLKPASIGDSYYHIAMELSGVLLILLAIGLRLWCTLYIGGRKNAELATVGPYSLCRNPLYTASIIGAAGVGLQTGMATYGIVCATLCWMVFALVVRREEVFLTSRFGPAYTRYRQATPRFLPAFRLYDAGPDRQEFEPSSLWRTLRDGLVFLLALPLTEVTEELHEMALLPAVATLF